MSMENIERYIQDLEAIKNYSQVKRDKEYFSQEIEKLKVSLETALQEVSSLKSSKAKLDGAEMTLDEARLDFIHAQDAEIEKRATSRFEELKVDYESKMPQLVYQKLRDLLKQPQLPEEIAKLIRSEANKNANNILYNPNNWPGPFKKLYEEEVNKNINIGLNQEFEARVETTANSRAQQKLAELTKKEWPAWCKTNVDPRIAELESKILVGAFDLLRGPWILTCDRCATSFSMELIPEEIEKMLRSGQMKVVCSNPECQDTGLFSNNRHTFSVSLHNLIVNYLTR